MSIDKLIIPPNENPSIEIQEKWEVIRLPEKQCKEPNEHSPDSINNLLDRTRQEFNNYILEISENFDLINKEIEIDIRLKSNILKDELNLLKKSGNENIECLLIFQTDIFSFEEIKFNNSKNFCENLLEKGKLLIDEFHELLKDLEKYRSDKFKEILKEYYGKMEKCSYKLPYEIQLFFEEKILHINQMLLTNLRNSKELHLDLMVIFANDVKLLIYNITKYEEEWKDICKTEIIRRLKEYNLTDDEIDEFFRKYQDKTMTEIILLFYEYEALLLELLRCDPKELAWYNETKKVISDLDNTAKQLVNLYEEATNQLEFKPNQKFRISIRPLSFLITKQYIEEYGEYEDEGQNYAVEQELEGEAEAEEEKEEVILSKEELEKLWKNTLRELLQFLHMKYIMLTELKDLWKKHEDRIEKLKLVVLKDVEQCVIKNDKLLQEKQEMPLNIAIDSLRQELNEKKMEKSMKKVTNILNKMSQAMTSHKETELKLISKYVDYVNNESEIFTTALSQFMNKFEEEVNVPIIREELGKKNLDLFTELQKCSEPIEDINLWKLKIIEQLNKRMNTFAEKQQQAAKSWIAEHEQKVIKKFENKLALHKMRNDRIQLEIYDVRVAEIKKHQEKFELHKAGIEKRLTEIQEKIHDFETSQDTEIGTFLTKLNEMADESKNCKTSISAQICIEESNKLIIERTNCFRETIKDYVEHALKKISQILSSNYSFLQHIKLFNEGGNFNPKEAAAISKKLLQLDTVIQKRSSLIKSGILAIEKRLLKNIDSTTVVCSDMVLNVPINVSPAVTPKSKSSKKSVATSKKIKKEAPPVFMSFELFQFFNNEKVYKYMPNVCHILQQAFLKTQGLAKEFYGNLFEIGNVELPLSYNEFMSGILQKYKYYYLQCLQAWAEEIQDFTMVTNDFLLFANQYCNNYLQWLHKTQFNIFKEKQQQYFNTVENVQIVGVTDMKNVQNQLKPLHGYPGNYQLLVDLIKNMNDVMQIARSNFDVSVEPYEDYLKECMEAYKDMMNEANELISNFKSVLFDEAFCKKLISQAKCVINSTNFEDYDIDVDNIITYSHEAAKNNSEENLSNLIGNIEDELRVQIVEEEARTSREEMSKIIDKFNEKLASLLKTWEIDLNKVTDLYKVKYD